MLAVSEAGLLALLWTLEAWGDVSRSRCSEVLYSYLGPLGAVDPQVRGGGGGKSLLGARGCALCSCSARDCSRVRCLHWCALRQSRSVGKA